MSDLCMYELEDNVWDEFGESGDLIVPHPGEEDCDTCVAQGDSRKKARHGEIGMTDFANNATKRVIKGKDEMMTNTDTMLEKGSWSQTTDGESIKELTGRTTNGSRMPDHCLNVDNKNVPISADCNSNSYDFPLSHISQADNELSFYDNDGEDKEANDLLHYEWPDIGNFEDVDRMLRSCDSNFGLGSLSNDEELCWFPPSHPTEVPEEAVKSGFNFLCPEPSALKNVFEPDAHSDKKSVSLSDKVSSQTSDGDDLVASDHVQFMNELDVKSENSSQQVHSGQISLQRKQSKRNGRPDGKRKYRYSEDSGSFHRSSNLTQVGDVKHPFGGDVSLTYMQTHAPYTHLDFSNPSNQISVPSLSGAKSENESHPSPSPNESSQGSSRVSAQKQMNRSEHGIGGCNEVEGAETPKVLGLSNVQESTCMRSALDEVSPQASGFRQLQQVVEQLDIRTKLCIRDSLYRLARSAEQRHTYINPSGGISNDRDLNGALVADETNRCTGFMDIETNTNPIDRSIAHLLFHRPQDPSSMPSNDASSVKPHPKVHVPPMKSENQETATDTRNNKLS